MQDGLIHLTRELYMKIATPKDKVKILRQGDSDFVMHVGAVAYPRAGFEISQLCPANYKQLLYECFTREWIKPVAYMKESEYIWEELSK